MDGGAVSCWLKDQALRCLTGIITDLQQAPFTIDQPLTVRGEMRFAVQLTCLVTIMVGDMAGQFPVPGQVRKKVAYRMGKRPFDIGIVVDEVSLSARLRQPAMPAAEQRRQGPS